MNMEEKIFKFDTRHRNTVYFSVGIYVVCIIFLTLESILSGISLYGSQALSGIWEKLLFNRANNSSFMLLIYICLDAYCMMGTAKNLLVLSRVKKTLLCVTDETISGFAFGTGKSWNDGKTFSLAPGDIASVGMTEGRLVGRSMINTLVINTAEKSFCLPGLEDEEAAKKLLEDR